MSETTKESVSTGTVSIQAERNGDLRVVRRGVRWYAIEGASEGWVKWRTFRTKWKAEIALEVFRGGGTFRAYCLKMNEVRKQRRLPEPKKALAEISKIYDELAQLNWSGDDVVAFAAIAGYGAVTTSRRKEFFRARIHDTWGYKWGGRVHIDLGDRGIHLMLNRTNARRFVEFLRERHQTRA